MKFKHKAWKSHTKIIRKSYSVWKVKNVQFLEQFDEFVIVQWKWPICEDSDIGVVFKWVSKKTIQSNNSQPITKGANSAMNQSEKQSEKSRVQEVIGWSFASHWLKNWQEIFFSQSPSFTIANCVITAYSHLNDRDDGGLWPRKVNFKGLLPST